MTTPPIITEEMRRSIGVPGPALTTEIERGAVRRFAQAMGDPNPLFSDEAAARKSRYGGSIAPPTFLRSIASHALDLPFLTDLPNLLDGGSQWEYGEPVRPGDSITAVTTLVELSERRGRLGAMLVSINETTYTNQLKELVAVQRSTLIRY